MREISGLSKRMNVVITALLIFQLTGCGTLLYPERRGQVVVQGRLDAGVVILDALGLLFFIIPGVIAFAVDFGNGSIYLPVHHPVIIQQVQQVYLKQIKFDPKHTSLAQIERIIKDQTGYAVKLTEANTRVVQLKSKDDMMKYFAQAGSNTQDNQLALNR